MVFPQMGRHFSYGEKNLHYFNTKIIPIYIFNILYIELLQSNDFFLILKIFFITLVY